jgi:MoxR-like ATPase
MANGIFQVNDETEYRQAGGTDLIHLLPAPNSAPLFLPKWVLEAIVWAIVGHEFVHLSGPTGTAKTSLIEALDRRPENFRAICSNLDLPYRPIKLFAVEMAIFESPGELIVRRALRNGRTFDEKSILVQFIEEASKVGKKSYPLIYLREIGRVHSASVQGGLLDLITSSDIDLPDRSRIETKDICWLADSNYQAEEDCRHTLVTLDDALARRFSVNLTLTYLSAEQERDVVRELCHGQVTPQQLQIVKLGNAIRAERAQGRLQSVPPPTIAGYLSFVKMAQGLSSMTLKQVAQCTLVGSASNEDCKCVESLLNSVFGLTSGEDDSSEIGDNLF